MRARRRPIIPQKALKAGEGGSLDFFSRESWRLREEGREPVGCSMGGNSMSTVGRSWLLKISEGCIHWDFIFPTLMAPRNPDHKRKPFQIHFLPWGRKIIVAACHRVNPSIALYAVHYHSPLPRVSALPPLAGWLAARLVRDPRIQISRNGGATKIQISRNGVAAESRFRGMDAEYRNYRGLGTAHPRPLSQRYSTF